MGRQPIIGVTGPDRGGLTAWLMSALAVRRAGARAIRIRPSDPASHGQLAGIIIGGGTDVDPFHYGQQSPPDDAAECRQRTLLDWAVALALGLLRVIFATHSKQDYDPQRDQLEKSLILYALDRQLPVLGICRGAQLMSVTLGGSLHQNIGHFYTEDTGNVRSILPRKTIEIVAGSRLREILGADTGFVNALHNQSINALGDDVVVSAREPNGVIQGIEKREHDFFIGVQWHPEYMPQSGVQQALFRELVRCAREHAAAERAAGH